MLCAVGEAANDDAGQPVLALEPHEMVLEGHDLENETAGTMRLDLAPMLAAWGLDRRFDDAIILGAIRIGEDDQPVAVMLDGIVVLGFARADETRRSRWILRVDQPDLGRLVIGGVEQQEAPALGLAQAEKVSWIRLLMDESILPVRADGMAQDLARAVLVVEPDIEQRPTVGRPFETPIVVGDVGIDDERRSRPRRRARCRIPSPWYRRHRR